MQQTSQIDMIKQATGTSTTIAGLIRTQSDRFNLQKHHIHCHIHIINSVKVIISVCMIA